MSNLTGYEVTSTQPTKITRLFIGGPADGKHITVLHEFEKHHFEGVRYRPVSFFFGAVQRDGLTVFVPEDSNDLEMASLLLEGYRR